ncbi:unnamed protein product [Symbiodinium sp. CCMP2592]|nr:unnamed protein product [Symbiodinium sp. CCMP2592]
MDPPPPPGPGSEPRSLAPSESLEEGSGCGAGEEAPEVAEHPEELLENDLYLLTRGAPSKGADVSVDSIWAVDIPKPARAKAKSRLAPRPSPRTGARRRPLASEEAAAPPLALPPVPHVPGAEGREADPANPGQVLGAEGAEAEDDAAGGEGQAPFHEEPKEDPADELERLRKRKKFECKPVEARKEGEDEDWVHFPSLAAASRETGVPNSAISHLCTSQGAHSGWLFRWPGAPELPKLSAASTGQPELPLPELEGILKRLRAMEAEERRTALAAMPEATRRELMTHLKQEASSSRLRRLLGNVPQLLETAEGPKRQELLQSVRSFEAIHTQVLMAPDMASVVQILRDLTPEQRHAIVEALPEETQEALEKHLRASKAAQAAQQAVKAFTAQPAPAHALVQTLCRLR